jgi:hypothetical protein
MGASPGPGAVKESMKSEEKGNPDLTNKRKALSRPTEDEKLHLQTPAFTEAIPIVPDQDSAN